MKDNLIVFILIAILISLVLFVFLRKSQNLTYVDVVEKKSSEITGVNDVNNVASVTKGKCVLIDDFAGNSELRWYTVNDGVMGGLSQGTARIVDNKLVHSGAINTNGGGFSYVGTRLPANILSGYSKIVVKINTNNREYRASFADSRYGRVTHQVPIQITDSLQEVSILFKDTVPTIFGRQVQGEPFSSDAIYELSFILSDGVDGPFQATIDSIQACI